MYCLLHSCTATECGAGRVHGGWMQAKRGSDLALLFLANIAVGLGYRWGKNPRGCTKNPSNTMRDTHSYKDAMEELYEKAAQLCGHGRC